MTSAPDKEETRRLLTAASAIVLSLVFAFPALVYSQPVTIPQGTACAECGMTVDQNSKFASAVTARDGRHLFFCDIGDMLYYLSKHTKDVVSVSVRDFPTGLWIDGRKAFYVFSLNRTFSSPMKWNIAAFARQADASVWGTPVDFNGAFRLLK
jgi:nitrous oxide reductase accessory protein NosL